MSVDSGGLGEGLLVAVLVGALWLQGPVSFVNRACSGFWLAVSLGVCVASLRTVLCSPVFTRCSVFAEVGLQEYRSGVEDSF